MAKLETEKRAVVLEKLSEAIASTGEAKATFSEGKDGSFQISISAPNEGASKLTRDMIAAFSAAAL